MTKKKKTGYTIPEITISVDEEEMREAFKELIITRFWENWGDSCSDNISEIEMAFIEAIADVLLNDKKFIKEMADQVRGYVIQSVINDMYEGIYVMPQTVVRRLKKVVKAELEGKS